MGMIMLPKVKVGIGDATDRGDAGHAAATKSSTDDDEPLAHRIPQAGAMIDITPRGNATSAAAKPANTKSKAKAEGAAKGEAAREAAGEAQSTVDAEAGPSLESSCGPAEETAEASLVSSCASAVSAETSVASSSASTSAKAGEKVKVKTNASLASIDGSGRTHDEDAVGETNSRSDSTAEGAAAGGNLLCRFPADEKAIVLAATSSNDVPIKLRNKVCAALGRRVGGR
jgi:hypothetical protein